MRVEVDTVAEGLDGADDTGNERLARQGSKVNYNVKEYRSGFS